MTILEAIQRGAEFLAKKGVDSPRLQAELLLAHQLNLPRLKLYLNFERELPPADTDALRELLVRRGQREPLQHLVGSVSFCGLELTVNRDVLVPRPETELLAEAAWSWLNERGPGATALDLGAGSGCLAIALAHHCPDARITAVDFSPEALAVAGQNAARLGLTARIEFLQGDLCASLPAGSAFDLIVSNPPYIPTAELEHLQPEVRDHDPREALDGGADGLAFYRRIAVEAGPWLRPDGRLMLEFGDGQAESIRSLLTEVGWRIESVRDDYSARPRFLVAARPG